MKITEITRPRYQRQADNILQKLDIKDWDMVRLGQFMIKATKS
jgi:hypothetical protein